MTELNVELARKTIEHIAAHPDEHLQRAWISRGRDLRRHLYARAMAEARERADGFGTVDVTAAQVEAERRTPACGTAACFAGHAVLIAGMTVRDDAYVEFPADDTGEINVREVRDVAVDLLGLTVGQAEILFDPMNTVDDLWGYLALYSDGAITRPIGENR